MLLFMYLDWVVPEKKLKVLFMNLVCKRENTEAATFSFITSSCEVGASRPRVF